jgi:hypothetical protein
MKKLGKGLFNDIPAYSRTFTAFTTFTIIF